MTGDEYEIDAGAAPMKYAAFISYAHADERAASRLHRALETFALPKELRRDGAAKLKPIFRDAAELTAHHSLSEKIQMAVETSRCLIVLCSPAAKASHWVNEEIRLFRRLHGEGAILCALVEGDPGTAFPPALLEGGREPLAANLSAQTFRLGTTQLAAAMLGVGLDDLVQRDARRRARRMQIGLTASLIFSGLMGLAAFLAIDARGEAEAQRLEAEGLIEYMITDLKDKLAPLGKLELLDDVGDQAVGYYDDQDAEKLSDQSLLRQAHARFVIAEVALDMKNLEKATQEINIAAQLTKQVRARSPDEATAIYADGQSAFWLGKLHYDKREFEKAKPYWTKYRDLGLRLHELDPKNIKWIMEAAYGENAIGSITRRQADDLTSFQQSLNAIRHYDKILEIDENHFEALKGKANAFGGASRTAPIEEVNLARNYRLNQIEIYEKLTLDYPDDIPLKRDLILARQGLQHKNISSREEFLVQNSSILDAFEELIIHEPKNARWSRDYLRAFFYQLKLLYDAGREDEFNSIVSSYEQHLNIHPETPDHVTAARFKIVKIMQENMKGDKEGAFREVKELSEHVLDGFLEHSDDAQVEFEIACLNIRYGSDEMAKKASKAYLSQLETGSLKQASKKTDRDHLMKLVREVPSAKDRYELLSNQKASSEIPITSFCVIPPN